MKRTALFLLTWILIGAAPSVGAATGPAVALEVNGIIGAAMKNYVIRGIRHAEEHDASCVIIKIDTPGGLMDSMKDIGAVIVNARVPVAVFVYPRGSTATSAGFFLLMAADFAVMAPGTSTGSAHPVSTQGPMDKTMKEKVTNFSVSLMDTYTRRRGRNMNWAQKAVRRSVSITAEEAVKKNVADLLADSIPDLLKKLDGRKLEKNNRILTLRTRGARVVDIGLSPRERFLQLVGHPNIAYILFTVGIYGLIFEITHPGAIAPGVIGGVSIILAFTAFQVIPINYFGLVLIIGGIVLFLVEVKMATHGLSALGGAVLMFIGSLMLVDTTDPAQKGVSLSVIISSVSTTALFFLVAVAAVVRAHRRRVTTGSQGMEGLKGRVTRDIAPEGIVRVSGELWHARAQDNGTIPADTRIEVVSMDGMTVVVRPAGQ